jgi:hypothetical protein
VRRPDLALDGLADHAHGRRGPEIATESFGIARRERSRMNHWVSRRPAVPGLRPEERSVEWRSVRVPATLRAGHEVRMIKDMGNTTV